MRFTRDMVVKLSNNVERSVKDLGSLASMAGHRCKVINIYRNQIKLQLIDGSKAGWWFWKSDIEPNEPLKPKPKPVSFDPQNLCI